MSRVKKQHPKILPSKSDGRKSEIFRCYQSRRDAVGDCAGCIEKCQAATFASQGRSIIDGTRSGSFAGAFKEAHKKAALAGQEPTRPRCLPLRANECY